MHVDARHDVARAVAVGVPLGAMQRGPFRQHKVVHEAQLWRNSTGPVRRCASSGALQAVIQPLARYDPEVALHRAAFARAGHRAHTAAHQLSLRWAARLQRSLHVRARGRRVPQQHGA